MFSTIMVLETAMTFYKLEASFKKYILEKHRIITKIYCHLDHVYKTEKSYVLLRYFCFLADFRYMKSK